MRVLTFVHRFLPKIRPCNITVLLAYWAKEFANLPTDILKFLTLALKSALAIWTVEPVYRLGNTALLFTICESWMFEQGT